MKIEQDIWTRSNGWRTGNGKEPKPTYQLVLLFGSAACLNTPETLTDIKTRYPNARMFGCSTAGEICGTEVVDHSLVLTAIEFEYTNFLCTFAAADENVSSFGAGVQLARALPRDNLRHLFVLSDGLHVNGSALVEGLQQELPESVTVTGGLSGDGMRFRETLVMTDDGPKSKTIAALGFYGDRLKIGFGSLGGWDPFGPERVVTRSDGNVLFEMDRKSALDLYKAYLGDHAKDLPASGVMFPLAVRIPGSDRAVVRTILSVNEDQSSMTFAGDIPQGSRARLMRANLDRLVDGSIGAARISREAIGSVPPQLAILVSCVGRKLALRQRIEEEIEGVEDVLGEEAALIGFYSYGEIAPGAPGMRCELHNQTMTVTTISEV